MTAHDPLCPVEYMAPEEGGCRCGLIARVRADAKKQERERIAQGVLALWDEQCCGYRNPMKCESCRAYSDVLTHAAARGEQP